MKKEKAPTWQDSVTPTSWIARLPLDSKAQQFQVEITVKVPGGVMFAIWRGEDYDDAVHVTTTRQYGTFSSRPYVLGQGADSTTGACIDTLYRHFCAAKNLDPEALYYTAYGKRTEPGFDEKKSRTFAEWEGLEYPNSWNDQEILLLLHDLASINNHALVSTLLNVYPLLQKRYYPIKHTRSTQSGKKKQKRSPL